MKRQIDKNIYVYHFMQDGENAIEYCHIFYDKNKDVYFVVPDSAYNDFIMNSFNSNIHIEVTQPKYLF